MCPSMGDVPSLLQHSRKVTKYGTKKGLELARNHHILVTFLGFLSRMVHHPANSLLLLGYW